jgi:hypothetical protein
LQARGKLAQIINAHGVVQAEHGPEMFNRLKALGRQAADTLGR